MKFKILKWAGLLALFAVGATLANAHASQANVAIELQRTACFGACPVYTLSILEDGTVRFNGEQFVEVTGEQSTEIDPATVAAMVEAFATAGYFEWNEAYDNQTVSDFPTIITSVTRDGETHRIVHYTGDSTAPLALSFLEQWIDAMANTQIWTGVQSDVSTISNGTDTPVITLQQETCFGTCPVYSLALYENGTGVFSGIANVNAIGVRVVELDPLEVMAIAQRAELTGYFDWQDSYQEMLITDQATIVSSIRWEDQFKRIVRYDGDPNAPIGLVRLEESIARLVADLIG